MEKLSMCRICLAESVRLCVVTDKSLQEMYEKLTDVPFVTEDRRPMLACFFCCTRLKQCCQLQRKCVEAEELLAQMLSEDYEQKPLTNRGHLESVGGFIITPVENISIGADCQIGSDAIKQELPAVYEELKDVNLENLYTSQSDVEPNHSSKFHEYQCGMKIEIQLPEEDEEMDNLELEIPEKNNPVVIDIPVQDSESDIEYNVPLLETMIETEEDLGEPKSKRRACEIQSIDLTSDLKEEAPTTVENLPLKSKERYLKSYDDFIKWCVEKKVEVLSENVLLVYFNELSKTYKPSTLWSVYSMLKMTLSSKHNVDIKNYESLTPFLKRQADGFKATKSKVFTSQEIQTFLHQAPDEKYLVMKVALILGVHGACHGIELLKITVDGVENHSDDSLLVKFTDTKQDRSFVIRGEYKTIVQKYLDLRPPDVGTNRFFIRYQNGKCFKQVIGKNYICNMPQVIATYLKLPNIKQYTGHCFRRTSATLLADSGLDLTVLKRGWKSSTVAEGHIEDSNENKTKTSERFVKDIKLPFMLLSPRPSSSKHGDSPS